MPVARRTESKIAKRQIGLRRRLRAAPPVRKSLPAVLQPAERAAVWPTDWSELAQQIERGHLVYALGGLPSYTRPVTNHDRNLALSGLPPHVGVAREDVRYT